MTTVFSSERKMVAEVGLQLGADHRVEGTQRLVEQDDPGVEHQGAHQAGPLLLAARELGREAVEAVGRELGQLGQLGEPVIDPARSQPRYRAIRSTLRGR